jgi:hypothetical protein
VVWHYDSPLTTLNAQGASAYPIQNTQLTEDDIVAVDWLVSDASMTFPAVSILNTAAAQRQFIIPETSSQYASFNGTAIDGKKWKAIAQADIPLYHNSRFFGEFILDANFVGDIEVMFWTSIDGMFSTVPLASFGLKIFYGIMEQAVSEYRSANPSTTPSYDLSFTPNSPAGGVLVSTIERPEGKRGVYNLSCDSMPDGRALGHLAIFARSIES